MLNKTLCIIAAATLVAAFSGCNKSNSLFKNPPSTLGKSPSPQAPAPPPPTNPAAPYVLRAESAGPYIDFSIYNLGTKDIEVKKEDLAVIAPDTHEVIPYTKAGAIIDLPQPAIIKPNSTLNGRAIFKQINTPLGKRLVFKPDATGTFADIKPVSVGR